MGCLICCDYATYDQLCFCDQLIGSTSKEGRKEKSHAFCRECLQGYTKAALETKPFARGWLGLKCMAEKCENPIPWQELKSVLPDEHEAIVTLENQCVEFCVSAAGLCLERCAKCNYAIDMDCPLPVANNNLYNAFLKLKQKANDSYDKLKFHCSECHYEMCRKCNAKWAEEHNNLTCEQFAKQQNEQIQRNLK
ncbi:hypothetical protein niasHT_033380 [Heterodera trifolii]|uniref:RING-type domain-containing protein n=1 Tax=Heterodera trifolii TaxID=157864 RepID=A0ABD2I112_9BILA